MFGFKSITLVLGFVFFSHLSGANAQPSLQKPYQATQTSASSTLDGQVLERSRESDQELGISIGGEAGAGFTPGGVYIGGSHLYQLTDRDWLESVVGVTYGNGGQGCFRNRLGTTDCDFGATSGFSFEIGARIRREFTSYKDFVPYVSAGLHFRALGFGRDGVRGVAFPISGAVGVRYPVRDGVHATVQTLLRAGAGAYNRDIGWKPHASIGASAGLEFSL